MLLIMRLKHYLRIRYLIILAELICPGAFADNAAYTNKIGGYFARNIIMSEHSNIEVHNQATASIEFMFHHGHTYAHALFYTERLKILHSHL